MKYEWCVQRPASSVREGEKSRILLRMSLRGGSGVEVNVMGVIGPRGR